MCCLGREQVRGTARRTGVAAVMFMFLCSPSVADHCLSHITVTGGATVTEEADSLYVTLQLRETTEVGRLLYRLRWGEELVAPSIPKSEEFASYFYVDDSVSRELRVTLKKSLVGLPDYPVLKTNISTLVAFPASSGGKQCSVCLLHLLLDENTQAPSVKASHSFLQVAKNFAVFTPLQGFTVTLTDNDAAVPNNQIKLAVGGACPLAASSAAAAATEGTETLRYEEAAGQRHLLGLHLTSPLQDLGNETFTCTLRVTDMGSPPLSSSVTFTLHVVDEQAPITTTITDTIPRVALPFCLALSFYLAEVWPGMDAGTPLITYPESIKVKEGGLTLPKVTYTLRDAWPRGNASEYFAINSTTGQVSLRRKVSSLAARADVDSGGSGDFLPLLIQAQDSSGRVSTAVLQVKLRLQANPKQNPHDEQPSRHLASSTHPQPSIYYDPESHPQPSSSAASHTHPQPSIYPSNSLIPDSAIHLPPFIYNAFSTHPQQPPYPVAASLLTLPNHPRPSAQPASLTSCPCLSPHSRGRASFDFSKMSYAAEVFQTDTFVGRVEAKVVGRVRGLVRYFWAPGTDTTSFLVDSNTGVITVAPTGVSPGEHHLTVRATVGPLTTTAQVTVRVLEGKRKTKKKQDDEEDIFRGLRSDSLRTCEPEELVGLKVAAGVLASLLGLVLLAAGVVGVLLYRRRKAKAQAEVKHISTLGSAYPNLSFSRDSPE